jgi:hypothetical protein
MGRLTELLSAKKDLFVRELGRYRPGLDNIAERKTDFLADSRGIFIVLKRFLSHIS